MTMQSLAQAIEAATQRCRQMDAPLAERLNALANEVRHLDQSFAEVVDRMVNRLQQIEVGKSAPSVGDRMPLFVLPDETGRLVGLTQLLERGPVVISFHRGHWCPYCRISADALAGIEPEVRAAGAEIVLITPEVQKFTSEFKSDTGASYSVLTDLDSGYALELQLAIKIEDEKRLAMTRAGWDISAFQDNENWTLPIPATFVVGSDGSVKARFVDPDYRKRMNVEDILGALRT